MHIYVFHIFIILFTKFYHNLRRKEFLFLRSKNLILNRIKQDHNPNALKLFSNVLNVFASSEYKG